MTCDLVRDNGHNERVAQKCERIQGLKALLQTHEDREWPDIAYIEELKMKIKRAESQLKNMRP